MHLTLKVAVTAGTEPEWHESGDTYAPYRDAVLAAGLEPVHVSPTTFDYANSRAVSSLVRSVAGLVLSGGLDVAPHYYMPELSGQHLDSFARQNQITSDPARDALEFALLRQALGRGIPVLAICRGIQLLNVAFGGKLVPDIRSSIRHRPSEQNGASSIHSVAVRRGTILSAILSAEKEHPVNSRHHQGFTETQTAGPLRVSAVAPDGFVEAAELADGPWVLGVQWHPERPDDEEVFVRDKAIFTAFASQVLKHHQGAS
ncbi:MAG: gamma-glutamyl-gamma-aminobutyrate hydrolase family protein [Armatimonadota bacterium]